MWKIWKIWTVIHTIIILVFLKYESRETFESKTSLDNLRDRTMHSHHVAIITKLPNSNLYCAGSMISTKYILTAAHCLERSSKVTIRIQATNNTQYIIESDKFKKHPKWQPHLLLHDIALLKLPQTANLPHLNPIGLCSSTKTTSKLAILYGWEGNEKDQNSQPILSKFEVTIISNKDCRKHYGSLITKNVFCAISVGYGNGCYGFSGGGLVVGGFLVGVMSFGTNQCNIGYPTVFTKISRYKKWIEDNFND